ncbi:MAG: 50S ribosomal protein L5 [Candidatus Comchoanobacterales bacterium]
MSKYHCDFHKLYHDTAINKIMEEGNLTNVMQVPTLQKIVVNRSVKADEKSVLERLQEEIVAITGQKPVLKHAKKSEAGFKLRQGMPIGASVTLRGEKAWQFFEKLVRVIFPRIRDFNGFSANSFDKQGNYTLGIHDQQVFFEIPFDSIVKRLGMDITFVINTNSSEHDKRVLNHLFLKQFNFPFKHKEVVAWQK